MKLFLSLAFLGLIALEVSCGSSGGSGGSSTTTIDSTPTFAEKSALFNIDDIVNLQATASSGKKLSNSSAEFYYARFVSIETGAFRVGVLKFKMVKHSNTEAYFSDMTLEVLKEVNGSFSGTTDVISSVINLNVPNGFNAVTNTITISSSPDRYVSFSVDFGNNDFVGDVDNAGIMFTSDFNTCAGGNNDDFIFLAQRTDSLSDASVDDLKDNFDVINYTVDSFDGDITLTSTSTVNVGGLGSTNQTAFTGVNSIEDESFDGEVFMVDGSTGASFFGYGNGDGASTTFGVIHGVFIISPDKKIISGYDFDAEEYFAVDRR